MSLAQLTKTAKFKVFAVWTVVLIALDQATKIWIVNNIRLGGKKIEVIPGFFDLVHAQNRGAAMGMLDTFEYRMHVFAVFTVVALVVLGQMLMQLPDDDRFQATGLGLITSGAIGNAIDRVHKQSVTDFLRVWTDNEIAVDLLGGWFGHRTMQGGPVKWVEWPSFNVADAAIMIGLGLFVIHWLFLEKDEEVEPAPPAEALDDDISQKAE